MRKQNRWLAGISVMLALHALVIGHVLGSLFFIVAFCWGWMAVAAVFDRLEAAKTMALTMIGLLVLCFAVLQGFSTDRHSLDAFYSLAMFPGAVAWACVYVFVLHIQYVADVGGHMTEEERLAMKGIGSKPFLEANAAREAFMRGMLASAAPRDGRDRDAA